MKKLHVYLLTIFVFVLPTALWGQKARLYTSENGLPNSQVNRISQDGLGFIWVCSENGLFRFDGMDFLTYRSDPSSADALLSNLVLQVFEDSEGTVWVGTSDGLQIYDPVMSTFTKVDFEDPEVPDASLHVNSIAQVNDELLVACSQHGVYSIDIKTHKIRNNRRSELSGLLPSSFINLIYPDSSGRIWFCSENGGLSVIESASTKRVSGIWDSGTIPLSQDVLANSFSEDPVTGNVLIGTINHGLLLFDSRTGKIRSISKEASGCRVTSLLYVNDERFPQGTFLVGTEDKGLKVLDISSGKISDPESQNIPYRMSNWKIHSLFEDNQGNIWVGAYDTGVLVIPASMYGFGYLSAAPDPYSQNTGACVTSILKDLSDGFLWIGTDGNGVLHIGSGEKRTFFNQDNSGLTNNSVLDIEYDKRGNIWIATYMDGLFKKTPSGEVKRFQGGEKIGTIRTARLLYDDKNDLLYVGTYGNGFSAISLPDETVISTISEDRCKWVSSMYLDSKGMLWIGTFNGPLSYNPETGRLTSFNISPSRVYSILEGDDGEMWIGTGDGLIKFNPSTGETTSYTEHNGLTSNVISGLVEDSGKQLWISTSYGLCRLDEESGHITKYYSYDGLQENEFRYGSAYKDSEGRMYFGGINGITVINPGLREKVPHSIPPVLLTSLSVMNEKVEYSRDGEGSKYLDGPIAEASQITLPFNSSSFTIGFAVLEYTNPRKVVFSYKLDKGEKEWQTASPGTNSAAYTRLRSGKYVFRVRAFFDGYEDDFSEKSITVRVLPPWYMTPGAFIFYILIILGILQIVRYLTQRKRLEKQQQEESEIKEMKLRMFTNISHEIRTPLTLVLSPLKKMREEESDPRQKDLYNLMYRNGLRINRLVNQLMDMRKIDDGQMPMHFVKTDIVYFIKDIMQTFGNLASDKKVSFEIESALPDTEVWIDQGNFDKVIFNLLSNAFKHTPDGGQIRITVGAPENNTGILPREISRIIRIGIFNSGSHIDDQYLDKVFERFFQADIMDAKVGSGVGLSLTKQLVELHHGIVKAENKGDEGVVFSVVLPMGNAHLTEKEMSKTTHHKDLYTKNIEEHQTSTEDIAYTPADLDSKTLKSKKSIIIVDDDAEIRSYIGMELKDKYNIKTYPSALEAWSVISTEVPDLVISDLLMEGMDGAELCSKIKRNPGTNHIPVVILTSSNDEESMQRCTECGADRYFTKPISMDLLRSVIANTLSNTDMIRNKYTNPIEYDYGEMQMPSSESRLPQRVVEVINAHIEDPDFSVEDLSREIGMSRVHMNRKLKEIIGMSPSNLIKSIRLKQAAYLLINDKVNISEVAYRVGFSTHSYFSSSFRDYFGMTPKEFVAKYIGCTDEETLKKIFG